MKKVLYHYYIHYYIQKDIIMVNYHYITVEEITIPIMSFW